MKKYLLKEYSLLTLIIIIGAGLRLWGIGFGLPDFFKFDGISHVEPALRFASTLNFKPDSFIHGTLQLYTLFFEYVALYAILFLSKLVSSPTDFLVKFYIADPTLLILVGRITQAVFGAGTIVVTYLAGKKLFNKTAGLIAAYILSISFIHVQYSHYIKAGILSTFLLMLAFLFAARVFEDRLYEKAAFREKSDTKNLLLAGLFVGLATSAKYYAAIGYVFILALQLLTRPRIERKFLLATSMVAVGFLIGEPHALLAGNEFINTFFCISKICTYDYLNRIAGQSRLSFYFGDMLKNGIGLPVLACSSLCIYLLFKKKLFRKILFVLAFPLIYNLFVYSSSAVIDRYLIPIAPFLAILAALGIVYFVNRFPVHKARKLVLASMLLVVSLPVTDVVRYSMLLTAPDTRTIAKNWIEENLPPGASIAVEGAPGEGERIITAGPNLKSNMETLSEEYKKIKASGKRGLLLQQRMKYLEDNPGHITYRLHKELILTEETIERIKPDYVVLCGFFDFYGVDPGTASSSMQNHRLLYEGIEDRYKKIKEFLPHPNLKWDYNYQVDYGELRKMGLFSRKRPVISGPRIYIYEKK